MSRVFRRIVSFLLGFVMGICSIAGALVGGAYWAYKNVSLEMVGADQEGFGDFNTMPIQEHVETLKDMMDNPQNYSIEDLEEAFGFDLETVLKGFGLELKNETADEKANVDAMKEINLAYLFTDGFDAFLDTVSPRVLFNWLPDDLLSYGTRARLAQYSMKDLLNEDPVTGNLGLVDALSAVKVGGLFPSMYAETYDKNKHAYIYTANDGDKAYLDLIGNFNVGSLVSSFTDERTSFLNEFLSGRMTDISQKPLDELLYELFSAFNAEMAQTVKDYAKTLGGKTISDLFIYTEDGRYEFSADTLFKNIKLGYLVGLTEKGGEWYDGEQKASGLKSLIANFSIYSLYEAIQSGKESGNMSQAIIDNLCYQFGDLSIGTFLSEFMGYVQDENGKWVAGDGGKTMNLLSALGNISVKGILGGSGTLTENLLRTLKNSFAGYRIGDFVSDFVAMERTEDGKWLQNGEEVMKVLNGLYEIEINDFIQDEYSLKSVVLILKDAVGEVAVGDIMGYTYTDGVWYTSSGDQVDKKVALICDIKFSNVLDIFISDFSMTSIVKCLTGELTIGDILETYLDFTYDESQDKYYNSSDKETVPALKKLREVKIWQLVAPFDDSSAYDLFDVLDQINLGDFVGERNEYGDYWTITLSFLSEDMRVNGAFNKVLDINLGQLLDPAVDANTIMEPLKDCSIGEIVQSALAMHQEGGVWESEYIGNIYYFMETLAEIPATINDIMDYVNGDITLEQLLKIALGGVEVGGFIGDFVGFEYEEASGKWINSDVAEDSYQLYQVLLGYRVIDDTYEIINNPDTIDAIKAIVGTLEIGHIAEPFTALTKVALNWTNDGDDLALVLSDVLGVRIAYILSVVQDALNGQEIKAVDVIENVCGKDRTLGDYVSDFLPDDFSYKPLSVADNLVLYDFVDIVIDGNAASYGYADNFEYLNSLFNGLMLGDLFAEFIDYSYDTTLYCWKDGNAEDVIKLLNALMSVKFTFIFDTVKTVIDGDDLDISDTVEGILGDNTIKYYTDDFFTSDNTAIDKVLGINIPQFFDIMIEGNAQDHIGTNGVAYGDRIDYLKDIFGGLMIGDTFASFVGYEYDSVNEIWQDGNSEDVYKILNAIMSVKFDFIFDTVESAMDGNLDISDTVEGILGDNTIKYYTDDFFTNDNVALEKVLGINIPQFVDIMIEGNAQDHIGTNGVAYGDRIDYLKDIFGDLMVGDTFAQYVDYTYSETSGSWQDANGNDLKRIVSDILRIKIVYFAEDVMDVVNGDDDLAGLIGGIVDDKTLGYYLEEFIEADKYEPFKYIYDLGIQEFVDVIVCGDAVDNGFTDRADYLEKKFGKLELGELFGQFISLGQNADGDWAKENGNGNAVKTVVEVFMSVNVYETFKFIFGGDYSGDALASYVKQVVGDDETIADLFSDLGMEADASSRYGYVFKKSGKDIYRVIAELFKINVVELARDPATYRSDFFGQFEFMDYIAMYGEFFGNYYDKTDKKWYDKDGNPADKGSMALMWTTLGLEGTAAFAVAYFFFNDWLVEQCGDRIYYDLLGEAMGIVYDEANDVYKFDGFEPVSDFWDLLMRTKLGDTLTKGFDFKGYFYDCNVLTVGNLVGYYLNKSAFADFTVTHPTTEWVVVGDYGQTLSALLNFSLKDMIDAKKDGKLSKYFKTLFGQIQVGDFLTQALGMESSTSGWKKKGSDSYYKHLFSTIFDINIVNTIDSVKRNTKNGFMYDELYGDIFGRDRSVAYYFADFLNQTYDAEKEVWIDSKREVLYSYAQTLYAINLYTFLDDMKANGAKTAVKNTFGTILIGDLTYDIFAKIKALGLKTEKVGGKYVNSGSYIALADNIYNISINDIAENGKHAKLWKEVFAELYLGDYIAPMIEKLLPKIKLTSEITYLGKENGYEVSGEYTKLLTSLFNIYIMDLIDSIKANNFLKYITGEKALGDVMIADIVFNKGTLVYDSVYDSWRFSDGEVVPFDFSFEALVKQRLLKLTIHELTNGFNYWNLINDLYVGHLMSLSRYAEFSDSSNIIYTNADKVYTIDASGNEVAFPYELKIDADGVWYYSTDESDIVVTMGEHFWFATKLFENYYNVTIEIDADGNATVIDNDNGTSYTTIYDSANDVYSVVLPEGEAMFNTYNGVHYVAEPNGQFRRYEQGVLVQRLSNIRVVDFLSGIDIYEILSDVYVGEILDYTKGDMSDDPENQYDYTNTYAKYKWYSDDARQERLTAVDELIANICLGSVLDGTVDIYKEAEKLKVKDVFDVDDTPVLNGIREVRVSGMTNAIKELYVGEVMEDQKIEVMVDENENYLYKSTDPDATYNYYSYAKNASGVYDYEYVNVREDAVGYYYLNGADRVALTQKFVWAKTNRLLDMRYSITDDKIYKGSEKVGVLVKVSGHDDMFVCDMDNGDLFYAILRGGVYYKAIDEHFREKSVTSVENKLICVVADLQLKDLNKANFSQNLINKITSGACIGEFFAAESTGILSLFTQAELNDIYINEFPTAIKDKIDTASVGDMLDAGLFELSADKQAKLDLIFAGVNWKNYSINQLVDNLLDKILG